MPIKQDTDEISHSDAFLQQFKSMAMRLRSVTVACVISFDSTSNTVDVQPCIKRKFTGGKAENTPPLLDIPVAYLGAGNFWVTFSPKVGDYCVLVACDRSLDIWKTKGGQVDPKEGRHHSLTDSVAYFGLNPEPKAISDITDSIHMRTRDGETGVKVEASKITVHVNETNVKVEASKITIQVGGTEIATFERGTIKLKVPLIVEQVSTFQSIATGTDFITQTGVSLISHIHTGNLGLPTTIPIV